MAEPISSASNAAADDEATAALPNNAEDRKAAVALNSLNANAMSQEGGETASNKQPSATDQEALNQAMSRLEVVSGGVKKTTAAEAKKDGSSKAEEPKKAKVKVSAEDVAFLVEELDLSKVKATELLRGSEGDVGKAVGAFLRPMKAGA